jgi:hypothetical protein
LSYDIEFLALEYMKITSRILGHSVDQSIERKDRHLKMKRRVKSAGAAQEKRRIHVGEPPPVTLRHALGERHPNTAPLV